MVNDLFPSDFSSVKHIVDTIQPMIESFFLIYSQLQTDAYTGEAKKTSELELLLSKQDSVGKADDLPELGLLKTVSSVIERQPDLDELLNMICWKNHKVLNLMIKEKPRLLEGSLRFILKKMPNVINFENKRQYFS